MILIYPSGFVIQVAKEKGEINQDLLNKGLQHWLDVQSLDLPLNDARRFCWSALKLEKLPSELLTSPEIKSLAKKLNGLKLPIRKHSWKTYSHRLAQQGIEIVANELDRQIIKWCKLFLDESQAAWSLPNREEGFYRAWRKLVQYDPALSRSQRQLIKNCPQNANDALKEALSALEIPKSQIQDYLEAHLLSLPGWAGMMLWRSQHSSKY